MSKIFLIAILLFGKSVYSQINFENCSLDNEGRKHGTCKFYDTDKKRIVFEGEYYHGQKHGQFVSFYKSGRIDNSNYFQNNLMHGRQEKYNENGILLWSCSYDEGKKNGLEKSYYPNGKIKSIITYKNGKLSGKQQYYKEDGNQIEFSFRKKDG